MKKKQIVWNIISGFYMKGCFFLSYLPSNGARTLPVCWKVDFKGTYPLWSDFCGLIRDVVLILSKRFKFISDFILVWMYYWAYQTPQKLKKKKTHQKIFTLFMFYFYFFLYLFFLQEIASINWIVFFDNFFGSNQN